MSTKTLTPQQITAAQEAKDTAAVVAAEEELHVKAYGIHAEANSSKRGATDKPKGFDAAQREAAEAMLGDGTERPEPVRGYLLQFCPGFVPTAASKPKSAPKPQSPAPTATEAVSSATSTP